MQNSSPEESVLTLMHIIGSVILIFTAGFSSLAGLGGGGAAVVILLLFFDFTGKNATIAVFACILGASFGNLTNQMQKAINGEPVVKYEYAFITFPLMLIGSFIGVTMNKFFPNIVVLGIIVSFSIYSLKKTYNRFAEKYSSETQELLEAQRASGLLKQTKINPFQSTLNILIFKHLGILVIIFIILSLIKGSQKFPSIIGIQSCSIAYWLLYFVSYLIVYYFYKRNQHNLKVWTVPNLTLGAELFEYDDVLSDYKKQIIRYSIGGGLMSGFGLGGGLVLVPLYRMLKLNPLQATATTAFTIFIISIINCVQAVFIGAIQIRQLLTFIGIAGFGSYFISVLVSEFLRRRNRLSYVDLVLFLLLIFSIIFIPFSLWRKYVNSGYDLNVPFGFGALC